MSIVLDDIKPARLVSANRRIHHIVRSQVCLYWRELAAQAALAAYGRADDGEAWHDRARIVVTVRFPDKRRRDVSNLYPYVAKPIVDGLVDARVIPDDDDLHVIGPDMRRDPEAGPHRVVIDIEDLCRCSICGDQITTEERANCPDRHGWEDHGTCCVGACRICKREIA